MKLTRDEFNELQRWIEVRDFCQEAQDNLIKAVSYEIGHNYDREEYMSALKFARSLESTAISKIRKMVGDSE